MAKKSFTTADKGSFVLKSHPAFTFVGEKGEYEIQALDSLAYDDWKEVASLGNSNDIKKILDAYKEFFLRVCPDLAQETIGDNQWLQFGNAYFEAMGES